MNEKMNERINEKMNMKRIITVVLILIFTLLLISEASAIGITPGRRTFDYKSGMTETIEFRVINTEYKEMTVRLYKEGELSQFIEFEEQTVHFHQDEESKTFTYEFKIGSVDLAGGNYESRIVAVEVPSEGREGISTGAVAGVATQLILRIPYPGQYIDAKLEIGEAMPGENITFRIPTTNLGTQATKVSGKIEIFQAGQLIETLELDTLELEPQQRNIMKAEWFVLEQGSYRAKATLNYGGKKLVLEDDFLVGEEMLEIKRIFVKNYRLNEIAKIAIVVESKWNEIINNVFAHLIITNEKGDIAGDFRSASIDLDPKAVETFYAYWDTEGVAEGLYEGKIILHYEDKQLEKLLKAKLGIDSLEIEIIGLSAYAIASRGALGNISTILLIVIIILVLVNLAWFLYFKRIKIKKNETSKQEQESKKPSQET